MSVKILIAHHKKYIDLPRSDVFIPIHVGRSIAANQVQGDLHDIIGDDTGDNISQKNGSFCELTAIYWAWKNIEKLDNPDYIGLFHYRRWLNLNNSKTVFAFDPNNTAKSFNDLGFNDYEIQKKIESDAPDIILPNKVVLYKGISPINLYDQYNGSHYKKDIDLTLDIIREKYPQIGQNINEFLQETEMYYCNMFVMKRELFIEYCEFIFDVLFEAERRIDISGYDAYQKRIFGFLAERLIGLFVLYKQTEKKLHVILCPMSTILDRKSQLYAHYIRNAKNFIKYIINLFRYNKIHSINKI
jgi:hypothetical protein